jgi:serine/threonine kinase 16
VTRNGVELEGEVVFDGDEEAAEEVADSSSEAAIVPYAHKDIKPG